MKTSAQWVKKSTGQYTATCTATLNKNTTQGQIRCSGQANAGTSAAYYQAKLTTNTWSATGYAP